MRKKETIKQKFFLNSKCSLFLKIKKAQNNLGFNFTITDLNIQLSILRLLVKWQTFPGAKRRKSTQ